MYSCVLEFHGRFGALYCFHPNGKSWWRQHGLLKHQYISARPHGFIRHCNHTSSIERQILTFRLESPLLWFCYGSRSASRPQIGSKEKTMLMFFDTEYKRVYDARLVCVGSTALTTDTLQNQRAQAQIDCDQTVVLSYQELHEKRSALYSSGSGFKSCRTQLEILEYVQLCDKHTVLSFQGRGL